MDGQVRLSLYGVVRELAAEELRMTGEEERATARHAAYFVRESARLSQQLATPAGASALASLTIDVDNCLVVHKRALEGLTSGGTDDALRILIHLEPVLWSCVPAHSVLKLLDQALDAEQRTDASRKLQCEALLLRSRSLQLMGRPDAYEPAAEAHTLACAERSARLEGYALARLGSVDVSVGAFRRGADFSREAVRILRDHAPERAANALRTLGVSLRTMGDLEGARVAHEEALAIRACRGDERGVGEDLACLGALAFQGGKVEHARSALESALERASCFEDRAAYAYARGLLGLVLAELGELATGRESVAEALAELERIGERRLYAMFLGYSAVLCQLSGASIEAERGYRATLMLLREQADRMHEGLFAGAASTLAWAVDEAEQAELLIGVAQARLTDVSAGLNPRLATALALHLGHKDLWLHRGALATGDHRSARSHLEAAKDRLADAGPVVVGHDDLRLAHRLLQKALDGTMQSL